MITRFFGICGLLGCIAVIHLFEGDSTATGALRFLHWPAMVLTGLGPVFLMIVCFDRRVLWKTMGIIFGTPAESLRGRQLRDAKALRRLSREFYTEGQIAFERFDSRRLTRPAQKMIDRLSVRVPVPDVRDLLQNERRQREVNLYQCLGVVNLGVRLAPSIGMLGTILGMVSLLATIHDPSSVGPYMSLALLTTFYGLFFSLLIWTPLQQRVESYLEAELDGYDQKLRWLELLERRKPVEYFTDSLELPVESADRRETAPRKAA